ncbi:tyrosine-type recombinase/integrase [Rhodospirillaceae bacterium SYSU D60014]|uniref:tyrosine-type recombinase/integrase n=1 Tax=Virgifigura deserti TaxID=2268457 RepID=UPI000E6712EB
MREGDVLRMTWKSYDGSAIETRQLKAEGKIEPGLTFHGFQHSIGKALVGAECDMRTIMAVIRHQKDAMAAKYTKEAEQRRQAKVGIVNLERLRTKNGKPPEGGCTK